VVVVQRFANPNQQICVESARAETVPIVDAMLVADGPARREGSNQPSLWMLKEAAAFRRCSSRLRFALRSRPVQFSDVEA